MTVFTYHMGISIVIFPLYFEISRFYFVTLKLSNYGIHIFEKRNKRPVAITCISTPNIDSIIQVHSKISITDNSEQRITLYSEQSFTPHLLFICILLPLNSGRLRIENKFRWHWCSIFRGFTLVHSNKQLLRIENMLVVQRYSLFGGS